VGSLVVRILDGLRPSHGAANGNGAGAAEALVD
jgi:hypothetical protein